MAKLSRLLWSAVSIVLLLSTSCTASPTNGTEKSISGTTLSPGQSGQQPAGAPASAIPPMTAVVCPDTSSSYPRPLLQRATSALADEIDRLARSGAGGATLYIRAIKENSYTWDAELVPPISIPAIPGDLLPPTLPPEPAAQTENPFARKAEEKKYEEDRAAWEREVGRLSEEFRKAKAVQDASIAQTRERLKNQTDQLRQLDPPTATASDIWGCIQKGSELLGKGAGGKYLVVASDLEEYGLQEKATLSLRGVKVRVVYFHCSEAEECEQRRGFWEQVFHSADAADVRFYNPEEAINGVFD